MAGPSPHSLGERDAQMDWQQTGTVSGPIRILHIINDLSVGGTEIMLYKLLSRTDRLGFEPSVISLNGDGPIAEKIRGLGISVESLQVKRTATAMFPLLRLARVTRRISPQIIQGWMYHGNLAAQFAGSFARKGAAVLWNIRQSLPSLSEEKPTTARAIRLSARLANLPELVLNNSQRSVAQHAAIGFPANKTMVIPNGFDTDVFTPSDDAYTSVRAELGVPANTILIGRIGRYHHTKDYPMFLRAAALLLRDFPAAQFVVAGKDVDWNNDDLRRQVQELGLVERIHLLGERPDIPRLTPAFDVAVSSSHAEGFPNVVGEAMACAVPCVVTDVGDSRALVGDTGKIVPARAYEALATRCIELLRLSSEERRVLGLAARDRIMERYSISSVARSYESLYQQIVGARREATDRLKQKCVERTTA
ncbi:MAG TPA: glycosyltransferase [Pyrinomonadaceae bacterium]|nr:glycosyltransferase [Pyrinomonadaceae bacterium]